MTVFTAEGQETPLPQITLVGYESRIIDLAPELDAVGLRGSTLGYLKLNYSGVILGLGAQLTLYSDNDSAGVDSPRSLSSDFKSGERDSAFWVPAHGTATLALTNMSTTPLTVNLQCGPITKKLAIEGHATNIQKFSTLDLATPESRLGALLNSGTAASCEISSEGDISSLRAAGEVLRDNDYDAPIRFYDPVTATAQNLTAPGLRVDALTHIVIHNTTAAPVTVVPVLREATLQEPRVARSLPLVLLPHQTLEVIPGESLKKLRDQHIKATTLTLETTAPKGAIIAAVTQEGDGLVEDIPLRTANARRFSAGAYPLRWEQDYTNQVSVTNTSDKTLKARALITSGEVVYTLPIESIGPGQTKIYDVDQMRSERVKDVNGYLLPLDAIYGKFMWSEAGMGREFGLMGRNSVTSKLNHRKSSFSCGSPCEFSSHEYPVFLDGSPIQYMLIGSASGSRIADVTYTGFGPEYVYPMAFTSTDLNSSSPNILWLGADPSIYTSFAANAVAEGTTTIGWTDYSEYPTLDIFNDCVYPGMQAGFISGGGGVGVRIASTYWSNPITLPTGECHYANLACATGAPTCTASVGLSFTTGCPAYIRADTLVINGSCIGPATLAFTASGPGPCN
ncbi:MAG TPA: hypothetical protein VK638_30940 [Edaphobacter sp.]|nr:hypothetical protein [Edaphobacter sp.]